MAIGLRSLDFVIITHPMGLRAAGRDSITLLHISDLQFGRHHRFGNLAAGDPNADLETLFTRLHDGLKDRVLKKNVRPEVIVVSGDLAEQGQRSEFDDARDFLVNLCAELDVPRSNVILVPGNHDVNWKFSEAYFNECEGDEGEPKAPYWRKWECYTRMFREFFQDDAPSTFTEKEPWSFWEIEDLKLAVAGLNSTMAESHRDEDHYGLVGDPQLRDMAKRLEDYEERGWFRLGVVHHNVSRASINDDENLRDADRLGELLAPSLNLLLHGHTHNSRVSWLGERPLPVLSTGSAALKVEARPAEVPNQFQLIRLFADKMVCWPFSYKPDRTMWVADTGSAPDGETWPIERPIGFDGTHAAFGGVEEQEVDAATLAQEEPAPPAQAVPSDGDRAAPFASETRTATPRSLAGNRKDLVKEIKRLIGDGKNVVISGPAGIGKTWLLEALMEESAGEGLNLIPVRLENGCTPRQALQLALHLNFGGSFVPDGDHELKALRSIVPKRTVLLIDNADSDEAAEAVDWVLKELPDLIAVVTRKDPELPDFTAIELEALHRNSAKKIAAIYELDDEALSTVLSEAEGNPQELKQRAATAKRGGKFDPDNPLASMLEQWPKEALRSLWIIGLLPSSIIAEELLREAGNLGDAELRLMQEYGVAEVILRAPASRFVSVHPQLVRVAREDLDLAGARQRTRLIEDVANHCADWLASGPPTKAIDVTLENLLYLLELVEDPSLRAELAVALIGDELDDPSGYMPSRGLTHMLIEGPFRGLLEKAAKHDDVTPSNAASILKNLGLFIHRANQPGAEYLLRKAKEIYDDDEIEDESGSASTSWILGALAEDSGSYRDAIDLFRAPRLNTRNPTVHALSHHLEGCAHYHWCEFAKARKSFELASENAERLNPVIKLRIERGLAYVDLAELAERTDKSAKTKKEREEVMHQLNELRKRAEELGRSREEARCIRHVGHAQLQLGDLEGAKKSLADARDKLTRLGDQRGLGATLRVLATTLRKDGLPSAAKQEAERSLRIARAGSDLWTPVGSPIGVGRAEEELAEIERIMHEDTPELADEHLRRACNIFEAIHHPHGEELAAELRERRDLPFPKVKGILFDLPDTLAFVDREAYEDVKREISSALGVDHALFKEAWANSRWEASTNFRWTPKKRIESVAKELERKIPPKEASDLGRKERELWTKSVDRDERTLPVLQALNDAGIKMVLVTNGSSAMRGLDEALDLDPYIEKNLLSCEVGELKPGEGIYRKALDDWLQLTPEECLYVGDGSDRELEGAKAVGLFAVRMTGHRRQRPHYSTRDSLDWDASIASLDELLERMGIDQPAQPKPHKQR